MDRWNVVIGNVDEDYTTEKWNDVFASVKVKVSGDFTEKDLSTPASCFETKEIGNIYIPNENMTDEEVALCVHQMKIFAENNGYTLSEIIVWG